MEQVDVALPGDLDEVAGESLFFCFLRGLVFFSSKTSKPRREQKKKRKKRLNTSYLGQGHDREAPNRGARREEGEGLLKRRRRGARGSCSSSSIRRRSR